MQKDLYTLSEVALLKECSVVAVNGAVQRGDLPATRVGIQFVVREEHLGSWTPLSEGARCTHARDRRRARLVADLSEKVANDMPRFVAALKLLSPGERGAITYRIAGLSYTQIGERMGFSKQRASKLTKIATGKILADFAG